MKGTATKGLSAAPKAGKQDFARYTGNVKSSSGSVPKGARKTPAGGKAKSNLGKKKVVIKKPGSVYK
jgi:hypothetical protein